MAALKIDEERGGDTGRIANANLAAGFLTRKRKKFVGKQA